MMHRLLQTLSVAAVASLAASAFAQQSQTPVSSGNATITFGQSFTPSYSGGSGTGNWEFCIGGITGFSGAVGAPAGTDLGGGNYTPSWTPPNAGSYGFYILKCADANYSVSMAGWYTLTVNKAAMANPSFTAGSYTITVNQSWGGPGMTAPSSNGTGQLMYCVSGVTNWQAGAWTPTGAGTFQLFVAQKADSNHTGNANDPNQGPMQVNYSWVTLNVVKQGQAGVGASVSPNPVAIGSSTTFSASGGSGTGAYSWSGAVSGTGTSKSASFTSAGTYTGTVYRIGDSTYNDSSSASATVTVNPYLTVTNGSGSGFYSPNTGVGISAYNPGTNQQFNGWSYSGGSIGNAGSMSTTFTTSSTSNGSATANYTAITWGWSATSIATGATVSTMPTSTTNNYNISVGSSDQELNTCSLYKNGTLIAHAYMGTQANSCDANPGTPSFTATCGGITTNGNSAWSGLTITQSAPSITSPTSVTGTPGSAFTYQITANNNPNANGYSASNFPAGWGLSCTSAGYVSGTIPSTASGLYTFTATASNSAGSGSATVTVTVNVAPTFPGQPTNQIGTAGGNASFSVSVAGYPVPTLQWQRKPYGSSTWSSLSNTAPYSGVTSATLTITGLTLAMSGDQFQCLASNSVSSNVGSAIVSLTVNPATSAPTITTQPTAKVVAFGAGVSFSVGASGNPAPTYQWLKNGSALANGTNCSGVTTSTLSVGSAGTADVANYSVIVSNSAGSVTSSSVPLAIITTQPVNEAAITGSTVYFYVGAMAPSAGATFQWLKNGSPLANGGSVSGATTSNLTLTNVQSADAASYSVTVTNAGVSATTSSATLTVGSADSGQNQLKVHSPIAP